MRFGRQERRVSRLGNSALDEVCARVIGFTLHSCSATFMSTIGITGAT